MLIAEHIDNRTLPDDDLIYAAFRVCYFDLFTALETKAVIDEPHLDDPEGYLTGVPFFSTVIPVVQLDLLADVWARHYSRTGYPATLRDAAVLWSILSSAGWIARINWGDDLSIVLKGGPREFVVQLNEALEEQWDEMFDKFWDDYDFLTIDDQLDLPPEQSKAIREMLGIPQEWMDEMFAALDQAQPSSSILENLRGLLTENEIAAHREVLCPEKE